MFTEKLNNDASALEDWNRVLDLDFANLAALRAISAIRRRAGDPTELVNLYLRRINRQGFWARQLKIQVMAGYFKADGSTDGPKVFGIQPTDAAGVVGNMFKFTFTLDTTPFVHNTGPTAPHFDSTNPAGASNGGSDSGLTVPVPGYLGTFTDKLTKVTQPVVDGAVSQAAPVTVDLVDKATNTVIGSGITDANGNSSPD